jgi:hypothetical protein
VIFIKRDNPHGPNFGGGLHYLLFGKCLVSLSELCDTLPEFGSVGPLPGRSDGEYCRRTVGKSIVRNSWLNSRWRYSGRGIHPRSPRRIVMFEDHRRHTSCD